MDHSILAYPYRRGATNLIVLLAKNLRSSSWNFLNYDKLITPQELQKLLMQTLDKLSVLVALQNQKIQNLNLTGSNDGVRNFLVRSGLLNHPKRHLPVCCY